MQCTQEERLILWWSNLCFFRLLEFYKHLPQYLQTWDPGPHWARKYSKKLLNRSFSGGEKSPTRYFLSKSSKTSQNDKTTEDLGCPSSADIAIFCYSYELQPFFWLDCDKCEANTLAWPHHCQTQLHQHWWSLEHHLPFYTSGLQSFWQTGKMSPKL